MPTAGPAPICLFWSGNRAVLVIVCYDVNTESREGRRRLRRVAKLCEATGQRVQKSVFECQIDLSQMEELERKLCAEIDEQQDCLRIYRLPETRGAEVREYGKFKAVDFGGPLVF